MIKAIILLEPTDEIVESEVIKSLLKQVFKDNNHLAKIVLIRVEEINE